MNPVKAINKTEPVITWPIVGAAIAWLIQYLIPDLQDSTLQTIIDFVTMAGPVLGGLWYARRQVSPVGKERIVETD